MDLNRGHSPCGEDVAPYALGALSPDDTRRFEEHLAGCELCQTDLAALQPVVDALPQTADRVDPPPQLRRDLMAIVEREAAERRRAEQPERTRRWWVPRPLPALAAACVLLVAGIGVGVAVNGESVDVYRAGHATLRVEGQSAQLEMHGMEAPPPGRVMQVWLMRAGSHDPIPTDALFTPNASGDAHVSVPGDLKGVDRVLVTDEPAGGSRVPTTPPSVDIHLS